MPSQPPAAFPAGRAPDDAPRNVADIANGSSFDELTAHHPEEGAGDLLRVYIGVVPLHCRDCTVE